MDIFDEMKRAPEEMQRAMLRMRTAVQRTWIARDQARLWSEELANAQKAEEAERDSYNMTLNRWNPQTNEMTPMKLFVPEEKAAG
jgi:hypothetical protein